MFSKKKKNVTTNEFNQIVEGTSLTKEAWKRLKKNKMAILGLIVVIIYALIAICADMFPLYPYDEVVTEHQHLKPSFSKTSGELMLEKKMQDLYYNAWKQGRLVVGEENDAMIKNWIANDKTNKVWSYLLEAGEAQRAAGAFEWSKSDLSAIEKVEDKIQNDVMVTINGLYKNVNGKNTNLKKLNYNEIADIYASMLGLDRAVLDTSVEKELKMALVNEIKSKDSEISTEDATAQAEIDYANFSEKDFETKAKANVYGKIETQVKRDALKTVKANLKENPSQTFPYEEHQELSYGISADILATKTHDRRYYLGTDYLGRDMLSRIVYGSRVSIGIGLVGTITSILIGILVGSLAGYIGGRVDYYLMRFVDVMYGLPYMLLVIIMMAIFDRSIINLFIALALISWLTIARMVRGQIMSLKNQEYVEAARSMGASTARIITRHMIPNSLSIIIVYSTIRIPNFIMQESFLSFLGLGVQAPYASWGSLIGDAVSSMTLYPWKLIYPSLTMVIFLFAMNFLGDGLRDAFDPQSKNQL
ncbi:MAG: ABC transporter permease subunit [Spirochaetales bacterium]|nr:ABC transporter permease subunit [Spirochaetales bacterium]